MTYSPDLDMMRSWVQDAFPGGKWKDGNKLEWLCKVRNEDKTPSCFINVEKRTYCDFGGNSGKLSELCEQQGIPDPYRKEDNFHTRQAVTPPTNVDVDAMRINDRWERATPASSDFPYLLKKQVSSLGLREDLDPKMGRVLLIPARSPEGVIKGLERITPEGKKMHLGAKSSVYHLIGNLAEGEKVLVSEGLATGLSLCEISGYPVAVSFGSNNLLAVAQLLRYKKNCTPVVCPDADSAGARATEEALKAGVQVITMPEGSPKGWDWNDLLLKHGLDEARRMFKEQEVNSPEDIPPARTRRIIRYNELKFKEPDFLIEDILESGALVSVYGATGSYKTYFVLDMLLCVAKGRPFHNREVKQTPAIYVCAEGQAGIKSRVMAWCTGKGYSTEEDIQDFYYYGDPISLPEEEDVIMSLIDEAIKGYKTTTPGLLAIDTLARTFSGDENSNTDMGAYIRVMDKIKAKYPGMTIILVHHTGHGDQTRGRGASALKCALDCEMGVKRTDNTAIISNTKMKNAECFKDLYFNAILETVGYNHKKNKPITDLYLEETEGETSAKGKNKLSTTDQTGLDSYNEALKEKIKAKIKAGDISDVHQGLHLEEWRLIYYKRSTAETQGAKETAFRRARKNLVSYGILEVDSDYYKLSGEKHTQTASAYFITCKGELDRQADIHRQVPDMSGDIIPDRHRHTPVGVSDVGHVGVEMKGNSSSSGAPTEFEEIIIDVSFNRQEYSEAQAQNWLDSEAPEEAKKLYQEKFDRMHATIKDEDLCREKALLRTWEHYHRQEVA